MVDKITVSYMKGYICQYTAVSIKVVTSKFKPTRQDQKVIWPGFYEEICGNGHCAQARALSEQVFVRAYCLYVCFSVPTDSTSTPVEAPKSSFFRAFSQLLKWRFTAMVTYSFHVSTFSQAVETLTPNLSPISR